MSNEQKPVYDHTHHVECRDCGDEVVIHCNKFDITEYMRGNATATEALPYLSREDREILISGTCPACCDEAFDISEDDETEEST